MTFPDSVTVEVTAEDISLGIPKRCEFCPIAYAIFRVTGFLVGVHFASARLFASERSSSAYSLPQEAKDFIAAFDNGEFVSPFTFTMTRMQ